MVDAPLTVPGYRVVDARGQLPTRTGAAPYPPRPLADVDRIVVHYSGVDADSTPLEIAHYQTTKQDGDLFPAIAYHFVVRQNGETHQCHDLATRTWHAGAEGNDHGIAVCLPMLYGPTPLQLDATARLCRALGDRLGRALAIVGHKDLMPTRCPGDTWPDWRQRLLAGGAREITIGGVAVRWGFYDLYCKLEGLRPGLAGPPLGPHRPDPTGGAVQEFAACTMAWREGRMWVSFK